MSTQQYDHGGDRFHGEPSVNPEVARLLEYYHGLQLSLEMFTIVSDNPMLQQIGAQAEAVQKAHRSKNVDNLILVDPIETHDSDLPLVMFVPETNWDEEENISYLEVHMRVDVGRLSDLEKLDFTPEQIRDLLTAELVRENYIVNAYLTGTMLEDGMQATVREAIRRQYAYIQSDSRPSELNGIDEIHRQAVPTVFFGEDLEDAVRTYMGEERYYADCTFPAFRNAAQVKRNELGELLHGANTLSEKEIETTRDQLEFLDMLILDDPDNRDEAIHIYFLTIFDPDVRSDMYDFLRDEQAREITKEELRSEPLRRNQAPQEASAYRRSLQRRIDAVTRIGEMTTDARMLLVADGLVESALALHNTPPDYTEED